MMNFDFDPSLMDQLAENRVIFDTLSAEQKKELEENQLVSLYKKNEFIYKEGDKPAGFEYLVKGKVKVFKEGVGGREQIIRMIKPLGLVGFRSMFAGENHSSTAVALEDSVVCCVPMDFLFERLIRQNPDFATGIIRALSKELGFSNQRTVSLTQKHIRGRLAESLILLKDKYGFENDGFTLKVYLSREDIANLSNMTTSNAIRTLSTFAGEKVIAIDGRKIKILDMQKLERISKLG